MTGKSISPQSPVIVQGTFSSFVVNFSRAPQIRCSSTVCITINIIIIKIDFHVFNIFRLFYVIITVISQVFGSRKAFYIENMLPRSWFRCS